MMNGIMCKSGNIFAACVSEYVDAEWRLCEYYYKAQGCEIVIEESVRMGKCDCEHCGTLVHDFETLIEEVKESDL